MKLCYVADSTSVHIQRWLNYFADTGHEVHLICWKNANGYHQNVHVHMLENLIPRRWYLSKYLNFIYWCVQVRSLVRTISPDVLDGHYASVYGFIAACADFHPLVITAWGSDLLVEARSPLGRFMVKYGMKKADSVLCTGPAVLQEILKLGIAPNKVHSVVLGGINTEQFYPMSNSEVLRNSLNIGTDEPVIISTRHLLPLYDIHTLIKAIPVILKTMPTAKFIIAGKGKQERFLRQLADRLHTSNSIRFVGWIPHDQLPAYLSCSDVYVSTALSDGTSNSLLEAMACGLAPVVTDIPANRAWIEENENGLLFRAGDYKSLAEKVIYLLRNKEVKTAFSTRNQVIVKLKAEPKKEMGKLEDIYSRLRDYYLVQAE